MKRFLFRVVSIIILFAVVSIFTGLSDVSAALLMNVEKPCCDECNKNGSQSADHYSAPDCPMFLCLSMDTVSPFKPSIPREGVFIPHSVKEFHLTSPVKSIFHPPAIV